MTKKTILAALTLSTVALTQASLVSADEVSSPETLNEVSVVAETQPIDPSTPIVPDVPTDPSTPPTTPDAPIVPPTPTDPTKPLTNPSTPPTNPDVPAGPGTGGDTTTPPTTPDVPTGPGAGGDTTTPSEPSQPANPPISDDAVNKDDQGNITVKPQVVAPNQTVVGTQSGQLLVQDVSGNTRLAEASEFGGQKNANGTVSFKTANGEMVTLPETGSTNGTLLSLLGSGLLGLAALFWKKKTIKN